LQVWNRTATFAFRSRRAIRLRIQASRQFTLRWTNDNWQHANDVASNSTPLGFDYVDIDIGASDKAPLRFTSLARHR